METFEVYEDGELMESIECEEDFLTEYTKLKIYKLLMATCSIYKEFERSHVICIIGSYPDINKFLGDDEEILEKEKIVTTDFNLYKYKLKNKTYYFFERLIIPSHSLFAVIDCFGNTYNLVSDCEETGEPALFPDIESASNLADDVQKGIVIRVPL
jgi:hypothetical protein